MAGDPAFVTGLLDALLPAQVASTVVDLAAAVPGEQFAGLVLTLVPAVARNFSTVARNVPAVGRRSLVGALLALLFG